MQKIILFLFVLSSFSKLQAQESETSKTFYSIVPQYLINRGIRIDIEKPVKNNHIIQFCPQFYLSERDEEDFISNSNEYTSLIGGGMNIYHKIFATPDFEDYGLYLSYGVSLNYFNIEYPNTSENIAFSAKAEIVKTGFDVLLGYQFFYGNIVTIDIYTGLGTRYSFMETNGTQKDKFNKGYLGYAYTGNLLLLGLRIGLIL